MEASGLEVDESLLTGEADAIHKVIGDPIMSGSFVVAAAAPTGRQKVGREAYAARLAEEASKFTLVKSELRSGISKILQFITYLLWPTGLLIVYTQLFTHTWAGRICSADGRSAGAHGAGGLVLMTSIAFAVGVIRLGRRQCLVQGVARHRRTGASGRGVRRQDGDTHRKRHARVRCRSAG